MQIVNNNKRQRQYLPEHGRLLNQGDLIPLDTAIDQLSNYHNRQYTLSDIQRLASAGNSITPIFHYRGKAAIFNPQNLATTDMLDHYDGYIPDDKYHQYFKVWARSPQVICDIDGWYSVDFRAFLGLDLGYIVNFNEYRSNPSIKISPKAIIEATRIYDGNIQYSPVACFPVQTSLSNQNQLIHPIQAKPHHLDIGFYDWHIPLRQIEKLHPDYQIIYRVDKKYYTLSNKHDDHKPKEIKISTLDKRFYHLASNDFAPLSIQLLAKDANSKPKNTKPIITDIGHNKVVDNKRQQVRELAQKIWTNDDPNKIIRTGNMVSIVKSVLNHLKLPQDKSIKQYFSDIAPAYAKKGGTPSYDKHSNLTEYQRQIVIKYSN